MVSASMTEQFGWPNTGNVSTAFYLAREAFAGFERLMHLNQQLVKTALAQTEQTAKVALSVQTPVELWVHQANAARPVAETVLAHNRQALDIAARTQAEFLKILDARFQQQQFKVREWVDGVARNAPAGSEAAVTVLKSAVSMGGVGYATIHSAATRAAAIASGNRTPATWAA
jgi:phasin family protein